MSVPLQYVTSVESFPTPIFIGICRATIQRRQSNPNGENKYSCGSVCEASGKCNRTSSPSTWYDDITEWSINDGNFCPSNCIMSLLVSGQWVEKVILYRGIASVIGGKVGRQTIWAFYIQETWLCRPIHRNLRVRIKLEEYNLLAS